MFYHIVQQSKRKQEIPTENTTGRILIASILNQSCPKNLILQRIIFKKQTKLAKIGLSH